MKDRGFNQFISDIEKYINPIEIKTIFDIGSRDGNEAICFAEQYPNTEIYAFEPAKSSFDNTCYNVKNYSNIKPRKLALSDKIGTYDFYFTQGNIGASSLLKPNEVPWASDNTVKIESVEVDTLDNFCSINLVYPEVLWVDVQGNEANLFKGGVSLLNSSVRAIYTECGLIPYYEGHTLRQDILDILLPLGFKLIREDKDWEKEANLTFIKE